MRPALLRIDAAAEWFAVQQSGYRAYRQAISVAIPRSLT
jgi:hypothetical protein